MTDNRDSVAGSDGTGGGAAPPPFPDLSKAPPAAAAPPAPLPGAPARPTPWGWIVAAILAAALITLICLYFFTSLLDRAPRDSWDDRGGSSFGQSGSGSGSGSSALGSSGGAGSGQASVPPPPPSTGTNTNPVAGYAPTVGWLQGTWGPACPGSSAQALTLYSDGRLVAQRGEGTWSLDGDIVTLNGNGRTLVTRWEYLSQDMARVTQVANGQAETVRRCP